MKYYTIEQKYLIVKDACEKYDGVYARINKMPTVGIHNFGLLHFIANKLGMGGNTGTNIRSINSRITKMMREFIAYGYPIRESKIKCCSFSPKETWHTMFVWEDKNEK